MSNVNKLACIQPRTFLGEGSLSGAASTQGFVHWHPPHAPEFSMLVLWPKMGASSSSFHPGAKINTKEANIDI